MLEKKNIVAPPDRELMRRIADGDDGALALLYRRYGGYVANMLRYLAPQLDRDQVDELRQEVFLHANRAAAKYVDQGKLKAWLYAIAARKARKLLHRQWLRSRLFASRRGTSMETRGLETEITPEDSADLRERIAQALDLLDLPKRQVVMLHVEGLEGDEISEILGIRVKTVWTRLHRARAILREHGSVPGVVREVEQ